MKQYIINRVKAVGLAAITAVASLLVLGSCKNNPFYDYEGDCNVTYILKFRYDLNLKWADAFASEVGSVRLYAFDTNGTLVGEFRDSGARLADPDYHMELDLPAGRYHLVAWCGLDNEWAKDQNFVVPQAAAGSTAIDALTCRLNRFAGNGYPAASDKWLEFMFHGELVVDLPDDEDGGEYVCVMPLTKDTNHVRVILQHLSGKDLDVSKFGFVLEDDNGYYASDNTLLDDEMITYLPFSTSTAEAGIIKEDKSALGSRAVETCKTAVADFSVGRMMSSHKDRMVLTITATDDQTGEVKRVASIPVIDYALLARDYYEMYYRHAMKNDQELLDREDEYLMTFFIDENNDWYNAAIYINSWRIVLRDVDL